MVSWPLNEIKLVDIPKILINLRKAKPEWFWPSDIGQVIFAKVYEIVWNLRKMEAKK